MPELQAPSVETPSLQLPVDSQSQPESQAPATQQNENIGTATKTEDAMMAQDLAAPAPLATTASQALKSVQSTDVLMQVSAYDTFASAKWNWSTECNGTLAGALSIPETGILGSSTGLYWSQQRFGKVPDPVNTSRKVLMFRANASDPLQAGAPRCELTFSPSFNGKIPVGQDFYFSFGVRLHEWILSNDEQIIAQWHWSDGSIPLGPFFTFLIKGNTLKIDLKHNRNSVPSMATTTTLTVSQKSIPLNQWVYFVVKAKISTDVSKSPYLKVWQQGTQIVNYGGPVGYNYPSVQPYAKIGHYHWIASYNIWDPVAPTRTVLFRNPALIKGNYTEPEIRSYVQSR